MASSPAPDGGVGGPIGYLGLGNMGGAIAAAMAAGREVVAYDPAPAAVAACVAAGPIPAEGPGDLARRCRTIFLCLPSLAVVEETLAETSPLVGGAAEGTLIVDQSTTDPGAFRAMAARLAARGIALIDAPVSGGPQGVRDRSILVTIGGSAAQYAQAQAALRPVSEHILHVGPAGSAMTIKLANNYVAAMQAAVALQALALAAREGCDPVMTARALELGSGCNYYVQRFLASHVLTGRLESGATIAVMQKDVALAVDLAATAGTPLAGAADLQALIAHCVETYGAEAPYNAIALGVSDLARTPLGRTVGAAAKDL